MKMTGIGELDAMCKALEKKYKKAFFETDFANIEFISTGSSRLDFALGGGVPRGRIIEIYGWESSGKTSLCLAIMKIMQDLRKAAGITNKRDLIIDMEHSLTPSFVEGFGIDLSQVLWIRPELAEEALQIAIDLGKSGAIDCVIFDSVDAMQNERQLSRQVGETDVGGISKDMNFSLRQLSKICVNTNTTYLFINQIKQNPGAGTYSNPNTTTGGNALKFYSSLRLETMPRKPSANLPGAFLMRIKQVKTKVFIPIGKKQVEIDFIFAKGFDKYFDTLSLAKDLGLLRLAGQGCKIKWTEDGAEEVFTTSGGGAAARQKLQEEPEAFERLRTLCMSMASKSTAPLAAEEDETKEEPNDEE